MSIITLSRRQSLSNRIHAFGGANGRGYRFGESRQELDNLLNVQTSAMNYTMAINNTDWLALYLADPAYAKSVYAQINAKSLDSEYSPTLESYFAHKNITLPDASPSIVNTPSPVSPSVTPSLTVTPGTTVAEHDAMVVANQIEAARLEALATANAARAKREAAEAEALLKKDTLTLEVDSKPSSTTPTTTVSPSNQPKSNAVPLLVIAGLAFLALKG
jgi:hypothetical protein